MLVVLQITMILPLLLIASQISNLAECKKISLISIIAFFAQLNAKRANIKNHLHISVLDTEVIHKKFTSNLVMHFLNVNITISMV